MPCRHSADYYLVGSRDYALHDLAWLEQQRDALVAAGEIPPDAVAVASVTDDLEILHVAGARAEELMAALCPDAVDVPFLQARAAPTSPPHHLHGLSRLLSRPISRPSSRLQMRELRVGGVAAGVFRISFTGEAGFELHVAADDAAPLWKAIWAHPAAAELGLAPFGGQAISPDLPLSQAPRPRLSPASRALAGRRSMRCGSRRASASRRALLPTPLSSNETHQ